MQFDTTDPPCDSTMVNELSYLLLDCTLLLYGALDIIY